jgi:hypothetical protein
MGSNKERPAEPDAAILAEMREWLEYSKRAEFRGVPSVYERRRGARAFNKLVQKYPALAKAHGLEKLPQKVIAKS